jgi:hypothetical protein
VNLLTVIRHLRLRAPVPEAENAAVDASPVGYAPAPQPSEEIRRRQLVVLERHVAVTRSYRGAGGMVNPRATPGEAAELEIRKWTS